MRKWLIISSFAGLLVLLVFTVSMFYNVHQKNKVYERVLNRSIQKSVEVMLPRIMDSELIFTEIIVGNEINMQPDQAFALCNNFKMISVEYNDLFSLAPNLRRVKNIDFPINNLTANWSQGFHFFIARPVMGNSWLGDCSRVEKDIILDDEKTYKIHMMHEIIKNLAAISQAIVPEVTRNQVFWSDVDRENVWLYLLEEFSAYTSKQELEPNFFY